jgi:hypothetical protein
MFALTAGPGRGDAVPSDEDLAAMSRGIVASMRPFPVEAKAPMDALFAFAEDPIATFTPGEVIPLVDFVRNACVVDSGWKLPERDGAEGSAYVVKVKVPLAQYLALNFHPGIPDYAVFPGSLRYSACLDSNETQRAYACIGTGPTGTQVYVSARMTGMEEITPNPESGSYFSYTNSRLFLRCKVEGRDVVFSCSETTAPSTFSLRGVPIGPLGQALFFYSEKPGLNLRGITWMLSQISRSTTLSIYVALNSNETAVTTFAWLNAGWKGMNLTRSSHILNSQINTLEFSRRIAQDPRVSAPLIASIVETVNGMAPVAIDADYARYLTYVRMWRDRDRKGSFQHGALLQALYDQKTTQTIPLSHRRALLVQERIRALMGNPTWSVAAGDGALAHQ